MGAAEFQPGSPQYALTRRMIRLADRWPWDATTEVAFRQLRIDMTPHLVDLLEQWLMTVRSTCAQGRDRVVALWPDDADNPMPSALARLIDDAGDLQVLRRRGASLIESLAEDEFDLLIVGLGRMLAETMRTVGGLAAYTEAIEMHTRYAAITHTDPQRRTAALITSAIAVGNRAAADEYLEIAVCHHQIPLAVLLMLWLPLIAKQTSDDAELAAMQVDRDGVPLAVSTPPTQDVGDDGELTTRLAADMVTGLRTGDTDLLTDAGRRAISLPFEQRLALLVQVARSTGTFIGQLRANRATGTPS